MDAFLGKESSAGQRVIPKPEASANLLFNPCVCNGMVPFSSSS